MSYISKLKQLLLIISESSPFIPNISKLSERIGINRNTFNTYLHYLQETHLTKHLYRNKTGIIRLQKPDKLFMENPNLVCALAAENANAGNLRETFFFNQLAYAHLVEYPEKGDFLVNGKYTFEIGGKGKGFEQIAGVENAYIAADDLEYGLNHKVPLWMFGFLY